MAAFIAGTRLIELLQNASSGGQVYAQVTGNGQLALGRDPLHPTSLIDFAGEIIRPILPNTDSNVPEAPAPPIAVPEIKKRLSRQSGKYLLDIKGHIITCTSLKELLAEGLRALEKRQPGTLDKLAGVKRRTKRIVARDANSLFGQPHLVKEYAEKLMDGWWFGTNNSADETNAWLMRACELCGLKWDKDVSTSL